MMERNDCRFIGTIHRIENKNTASGLKITTASLCVSNGKDDSGNWRESTWVNLKAFGKSAELLSVVPDKGRAIVKARFSPENWIDRENNKRVTPMFVVDAIYQVAASQPASYSPRTVQPTEPELEPEPTPDAEPIDDDIPF